MLFLILVALSGCGSSGGGGGGGGNGGGTTPTQYTLTVSVVGQGTVPTVPPGTRFDQGVTVILTAMPASGWTFHGWSGDLSGTTSPANLLMNSDKSVTATFTEIVAQDTEAPSWAGGSALSAEDIGATFLTLTWDAATDNVGVSTYRIYKDQMLIDTVSGTLTRYSAMGLAVDTDYLFTVEACDAAGNLSSPDLSRTVSTAAALPPDPETVAPEIDPRTPTPMAEASAFLYTGPDAVQRGVESGAIETRRVAVLRGRVTNETGDALSGVTVSVLGRPELGRTSTRDDGAYDLAVNGGGLVKVFFEKEGLLPVKRQLTVPWQNYVTVDDVVMIPRDAGATPIALASPVTVQVAEDNAETDADGSRQARLLVPAGTAGEMVLADGTRQALADMTLRVTEYTVGDEGPRKMPAEMPPNIAYTYAMDLSIDEAVGAGAADVVFDKPLYYYLDNFLGFPAGIRVPTGYYDESRGVWVPSESGRVIRILNVLADTVTLDTDGDDVPDDGATLAALGFTDEELARLSGIYVAGDTLWRVPIDHFSSWDCNFGAWPPDDADMPWFKPNKKNRPDPCKQAGSVIDTSNMALGEELPLAGLPFHLCYRSNRMPAFTRAQEIPIWDDTVSPSLQGILVELEVAGQTHTFHFEKDTFGIDPPFPASLTFTWDGKDAYGRAVQGSVPMIVRVGYVYDGTYEANDRWGEAIPDDVTATEIMVDTRRQIGLWNEWTVYIGGMDPRSIGLGGWGLDIHHIYDPTSRTLYRGNGDQSTADETSPLVMVAAGTGAVPPGMAIYQWADDGKKATEVNLGLIYDIAAGPDGSIYIADPYRGILKVGQNGLIYRVTGDLFTGSHEDSIEASQASVSPLALAVGPDESVYVSEGDRIRRIGPDGRINTMAGDGDAVYGPDGGPAMGAAFEASKIALASDGNLYILDSDARVVRKIGTDDRLTLFAGIPMDHPLYQEAFTGEGGRARSATFHLPMAMALSADGSMYIGDMGANRVIRIAPNGVVSTFAGNGTVVSDGDGGPAVDAGLPMPVSLCTGSDNTLYIGCDGTIRHVTANGTIATIGGGASATRTGFDIPAVQAVLGTPMSLCMGPDRQLYFSEQNAFVKKIGTAFGVFGENGDITVADSGRVYIFDATGRHEKTLDIWTAAELWRFEYDADGVLWKIIDADGDETVISHDAMGNPTAIRPPDGTPTLFSVNGDGLLSALVDPLGNTYAFTYIDENGSLASMTTPNGHGYVFEYDDSGRLIRDTGPNGGFQALTRETLPGNTGFRVSVTTAMGRITSYEVEDLDDGGRRVVKTYPFGRQKTMLRSPDGIDRIQYVDGTLVTRKQGPDPRYGMQVPVNESLMEQTPSGLTRVTTRTREQTMGTLTDTMVQNGRTFSLMYDDMAGSLTFTTPEGRSKVLILNSAGRVELLQTLGLAPVVMGYDGNGRAVTFSLGDRAYHLTYDEGLVASIEDPAGAITGFTRDAAGRIETKTLPDGRVIGLSYDADGNVTGVTPPGKSPHTIGYTSLSKLESYTPPGGSPTTFTYNDDGKVSVVTPPGGGAVTIDYDSAGRFASCSYPDDTVTATYDGPTAMLTELLSADGITLSFGWDGFLMTDMAWSGPFSATVQGTYGNDFKIAAITVNGSQPTHFTYDDDGLLVGAGALAVTRDTKGLVTGTAAGAVTTAITCNEYAEPTQMTAAYGGTTLLDIAYDYDAVGRIMTLTETVGGLTTDYQYTYDITGRLTQVHRDGASVAALTFDGNSNRTLYIGEPADVSSTYDGRDRLLTCGGADYGYNAAGVLHTKTVGAEVTAYGYDALGNLRNVTLPDGRIIGYRIDELNRRIGKTVDGTPVQGLIYMNALSPIAELDGAGTVISRFIYGAKAHVPQLMIKGGVTYRIISDHLGSPRLVVNISNGAIAQRMDYDAFGRVIGDTAPGFQPFGFAGGLYDADTGLVRFGARDYDAETGRWTTADPLLFRGGDTNLYSYVLADPVNRIDPTGLNFPPPAVFRQLVGTAVLDLMPSSQAAADASGAIGDSALETVTAGLAGNVGKDLREAAGVDIVNECSETYQKTKKGADIVFKTATAVHGMSGLRSTISGLNQAGGAAEFFSTFDNTWGFGTDVAGTIQTLTQ